MMYTDADYLVLYLLLMGFCSSAVSVMGFRMDMNLADAAEIRQFRRGSLFMVLQMLSECVWRAHLCLGFSMPAFLSYLCNYMDLVSTGLFIR